ncbi:hypothetical protein ACLB2K_018997 [Fragaria x ananassa]
MAATYDVSTPPINATAVAVDKDSKNSNTAVRWAIDHLVMSNPYLILIHVRQKNNDGDGGESENYNNVFLPFRGYCARKGIQLKEVVLDEQDVAKALLDYISTNYINNIVVGASTRNALTRRLKGLDVPSSLTKSAPEFCSVYVVHKGKMLSVRTARRPVVNTVTPPKQPPVQALPPQSPTTEQNGGENVARTPTRERTLKSGSEKLVATRERTRSAPMNLSLDNIDIQSHESGSRSSVSSARNSTADEYEFAVPVHPFRSMDISSQNLDFCTSPPKDSSRQSSKEIEAEMKRLKQELKQTMDMYSSACKEAISAKNKAKELDQWKQEEARKFEEARLAEENALAIIEMEKAKCKAAIEAAEAAQRMAEKEARRRIQAEMKAKKEAEEKNRALSALAHNDVRYRKYTIEEIEQATEKFADSMKIGEGGYGPVYKGKLDHTPVAIKVLRPDAAQGRKQFQQEVEVLSCIRYPNMVLLLGACPEYGCLMYEYMDNGSLEDRLLRRGNTPPISWRKRFKIASEISTALLFLHRAKPEPLVHRDLKPANILLDRNYVSKISDVGLARLVPASIADEVTQYHMTSAAGTFCYIDPEYQQTGMLTTKSDVYSLGIVLLQIITARPAMALSHHVRMSIEKGTFADMLDPTVLDWPVEEALAFAKLALKCTELRKKDRPDLGKVIVPELNRLRDFGKNKVDGLTGMYSSSAHSDHASDSMPYITSSEEPMNTRTGEDGIKR